MAVTDQEALAASGPSVRLLDRLEVELRYLRNVWGSLLPGPAGARLDRHARVACIPPETGAVARLRNLLLAAAPSRADSPSVLQLIGDALDAFRLQALREWGRLEQALLSPPRGQAAFDASFFAWERTRKDDIEESGLPLTDGNVARMVFCHYVLLSQLTEWNASSPAGNLRFSSRVAPSEALAGQRYQVLYAQPDPREMISDFFALLGLRFVLARWVPEPLDVPDLSGLGDAWADVVPQLSPGVVEHLVVAASRNPPMLALSPALAKAVEDAELTPPPAPARAVEGATRQLEGTTRQLNEIRDFSRQLVFGLRRARSSRAGQGKDPLAAEKPFKFGGITRSNDVNGFALLDSPAAPDERGGGFLREALLERFREYERSLLAATVAPLPLLYSGLLTWARRQFVLDEGDHFPLSDMCLDMMVFCRNVLVLQAAAWHVEQARAELDLPEVHENSRKQEEIRRAIDHWKGVQSGARTALRRRAPAVLDHTPSVGDMMAVHLTLNGDAAPGRPRALNGMCKVLARLMPDPQVEPAEATWRDVLPRLLEEVREHLRRLAGKSPVARIASPALEEFLAAGKSWPPGEDLGSFLNDPAGGPLREFAIARLVAEAQSDPAIVVTSVNRVLKACLDTQSIGGALFVAVFLRWWLQRLFTEGLLDAERHTKVREMEKDRKAVEECVDAVRARCFDIGQDGPKMLVRLFVDLVAAKADLEGKSSEEDDEHMGMLRQHWRELCELCTVGLRGHPWERRTQRFLQVFWLNVCVGAFERDGGPRGTFATGVDAWDDPAEFGSRLHCQLAYVHEARQRRQEQHRQLDGQESAPDHEEASEREEKEEADFVVIQKCLAAAEKSQQFAFALVVRGILRKGCEGQLEPDHAIVREVALRRP